MADRPVPKAPKVLEAEVRTLLGQSLDDAALRERLEELAREPSFDGLTPLWGPELYRRNRVLFRPFILSHFAQHLRTRHPRGGERWDPVPWSSHAAALEPWLAEVDRRGDAELFRRLYPWKHATSGWGGMDEKRWRADLLAAFRAARTSGARNQVLARFDLWLALDDTTATALYTLDATAARPFILKHPPWQGWFWSGNRGFCEALMAAARAAGDDDFYHALYRKLVPLKQWHRDIDRLADEVRDAETLVRELEKRHPEGWILDLSAGLVGLVRKRGRDAVPYLLTHLADVRRGWFQGEYGKLIGLAREKGWWDVWTAVVRTCARPEEYGNEVVRLIADRTLPKDEVVRRLLALAGVSREWNFGPFSMAAVHQLSDETALAVYDRFPELLRGPFRMHISLSGWGTGFPKLLDRLLAADDQPLIDYLASRVVTRRLDPKYTKDVAAMAERLADYYQGLRSASTVNFSRRAGEVLGQVPAYTLGQGYDEVIRTNRLARLLFERSTSSLLEDPIVLRDLLEAPEIHVQALAFRALGLDDARARELAARSVDLLAATLLRPLHRKTRALAFAALANAATTPENAAYVLRRAREALDLPDKRYPKENLVGLIGALLARWPGLRGPREQPVVYAEAGA